MTASPNREIGGEMVDAMHRSSGSFELVGGALIASLVGFGIDRLVGTTPIFTLVFALAGLVGASIGIFYTYRAQMEAVTVARTTARESLARETAARERGMDR